ncbi:S-layer protein [Lentilactobacillus kosonis]|uniref:TolA protein n=1 Tax=Lentilactobacillus kosonis TaxID=2810561 RepID=A0A401FI31_9LACO|nr:S-layer protein [Lentilactobacillus kosonis]GAY72012.1 TolA protein [Lentilactobacillus kosonis]
MKNTVKRSLFVGLAALGFVAAAGATNASAASVKVDFNQASSASTATTRNYAPTGSNALYTKAGALKGARQVASTATMSSLSNSKKGNDYFRGYRVAKLSNGSYYMKVVSFDKTYRGWIYVGKTDPRSNYSNVAGGLKSVNTTTDTALSADQQTKTYKLANAGTAFESQTFKAPAYTQYKVGRNTTDTSAYADDTFTLSKATKRTREGDTWVYVNDAKNPSVNGWVLESSLKEASDTNTSTGVDQTSVSSIWTYTVYNEAGQKVNKILDNGTGLIPLFNGNTNYTNGVNKFNRDASVKGDKKDVLSKDTLMAALKKDGLSTVYMKITPTILPRVAGGVLDNFDPTGVFMKFNVDQDALPQTIHYGDQIKLTYTIEPNTFYIKSMKQSIIDDKTANEDGYYSITVRNDIFKQVLNWFATNKVL